MGVMLQVDWARWGQTPEDLRRLAMSAPHARTRERALALYDIAHESCATTVAERTGVGREKAAQPPVGVLDCAFLPRSLRAAEVALEAKLMPEEGVARELCAAVEGDRLPSRGGQGPQLLDHSHHDPG